MLEKIETFLSANSRDGRFFSAPPRQNGGNTIEKPQKVRRSIWV